MDKIKEKPLYFERYSSKTKRVNIPVPSFELLPNKGITRKDYYSDYLIGRDRITEKLRSWLTNNKNDSGSYLITGYRGMGKTCFTNKVLYELTREANFWSNLAGWIILAAMIVFAVWVSRRNCWLASLPIIGGILIFMSIRCWYFLKDSFNKASFRITALRRYFKRTHKLNSKIVLDLKRKEWERINRFTYGGVIKDKSYMRLNINVNFGQEILDEREILCVLASQLHNKYKRYVYSPIANAYMWMAYTLLVLAPYLVHHCQGWSYYITSDMHEISTMAFHATIGLGLPFALLTFLASHQMGILRRLKVLRKRIDAALTHETGITSTRMNASLGLKRSYSYPVATTREIEFQLIDILERISKYPKNPRFYFVFDELDKVEVPYKNDEGVQPEYSNEKYLPGGGTSRKRKTTVLHLLGNLKFFTSTAKAKFLFIAGREMYDAYLADLTDRESAISSLFTGVIYVESFCKNEKSEKDVMYNTETYIARQLMPISYIRQKVMDKYIENKLNEKTYANIDINLKLYYEYLSMEYSDKFLNAGKTEKEEKEKVRVFNDARDAIDKAIILLYHFTVYLYHISNGSPKKMRMTFANYIRPIKKPDEFNLSKDKPKNPLETPD